MGMLDFLQPVEVVAYKDFMDGSYTLGSIAPPSNFESMLDSGLIFFGTLAVVMLGLIILEKFDVHVDESKVKIGFMVLFAAGMVGLLFLGNPIWNWIR